MPEVFTGKVLIPGDQIDAYLAAMKEAEEARAPFRRSLDELNAAFAASLEKKYSRRTVLKHTSIVDLFIIFLCDYTDVALVSEQSARPHGRRRDPRRLAQVLPVPRSGEGHPQSEGAGRLAVMTMTPVTLIRVTP